MTRAPASVCASPSSEGQSEARTDAAAAPREIARALQVKPDRVRQWARRRGWRATGSTTARRYFLDETMLSTLNPSEVRAVRRLVELTSPPPAQTTPANTPVQRSGCLRGWQRERRDARQRIVDHLKRRADDLQSAVAEFAELSARGGLPATRQADIHKARARNPSGRSGISRQILWRWRRAGPDLAPLPRRSKPSHPAWWPAFEVHWRSYAKPTVAGIRETLIAAGFEVPSLRSMQRHVQALNRLERDRGRVGEREMRANVLPARQRDTSDFPPNAVWKPTGTSFRHSSSIPKRASPAGPTSLRSSTSNLGLSASPSGCRRAPTSCCAPSTMRSRGLASHSKPTATAVRRFSPVWSTMTRPACCGASASTAHRHCPTIRRPKAASRRETTRCG